MATALVLGGSGVAGTAWQGGLLAGMAETGWSPARADLILCTSSAAILGARLALGLSPKAAAEPFVRMAEAPPASHDAEATFAHLREAYTAADGRPERLGRLSLATRTMSEAEHIASMGPLICAQAEWPARFACVAVNARTAEYAVFDVLSGVPLARAVAASAALPVIRPCVRIGEADYMDGGARSGTNADLAWPYDRIVIVTAIRDQPAAQRERRRQNDEISQLRMMGLHPQLHTPDDRSLAAIGMNTMSPSTCAAAYAAGLRQGRAAELTIAA